MARCLIGLGANLGDRGLAIECAVNLLEQQPAIDLVARSRLYETAAVGGPPDQPSYLNAAAVLETSLDPHALLAVLRDVEAVLGRRRDERWGARTLDCDLLLYDDRIVADSDLVVPHPRMTVRRFVLDPAAEIAGEMPHPVAHATVAQLAEHLRSSPRLIEIVGLPGAGKTEIADEVAHQLGGIAISAPSFAEAPQPLSPLQREWQRAQGRFERLRQQPTGAGWVVADFSPLLSLAHARVALSLADFQAFDERFATAAKDLPTPRFTVVLRPAIDEVWQRLRQQNVGYRALDEIRFRELAQAFEALVDGSLLGSQLTLESYDAQFAVREIVAAAQASDRSPKVVD